MLMKSNQIIINVIIQAVFVIFSTGISPAQTLTNNGAALNIASGAELVVNGDFENQGNGSIDNAGDIYLSGDWTNNAVAGNLLQGTTGQVTFNGSAAQVIGGSAQTWFNDIDLVAETELASNTYVSGTLHFNNAKLTLNGSFLRIESGGEVSGMSAAGYIVTNGNGRLVQEVLNTNVVYPIGTHTDFTPMVVKNTGTIDYFGIRVFNDVLDGGSSGTSIPEIDHCVNITWDIIEQINGGSDLTLTAYWGNAVEGSLFDRSIAGLGHFTGGSWDPQPAQDASGLAPHSITRSGITSLSAFAVGDISSPMAITLDLAIDLKVFLEGPFSGSLMQTDLNDQNLIPLTQPYSVSPWNYGGSENVVEIPNPYIVDWILVEIRDAASPATADQSTIIGRQAGFVLQDGSIVSIDGVSDMQFDATVSQDLYVVVFHRNHLGIMSANPLPQTDGNYTYNFTTDAAKAYGTSPQQKQLAAGIYGMYGGDMNGNGNIGAADKNSWSSSVGLPGYLLTDANLDGQTDNKDKNDISLPNAGQGSYVPE